MVEKPAVPGLARRRSAHFAILGAASGCEFGKQHEDDDGEQDGRDAVFRAAASCARYQPMPPPPKKPTTVAARRRPKCNRNAGKATRTAAAPHTGTPAGCSLPPNAAVNQAHVDRLELSGEQLAGEADAEHGERECPPACRNRARRTGSSRSSRESSGALRQRPADRRCGG